MGASRRLLARPWWPLVLVSAPLFAGCGFEVSASDASLPPDTLAPQVSCNALHVASPSLPSGTYTIDPDGAGGGDPYFVTCDMVVDGGGWTLIFFPPTNVLGGPVAYTSATPPLLASARKVLLAYRDAAHVAAPDFATFDLPTEWRTDTPFNYAMTDLVTSVAINGGPAASATVRFGYDSFNDQCSDPWLAIPARWGRLCIAGTRAPYFSGFATPSPDTCSNSVSSWNTTACSADLRFSIAVR